MYTNYPNTEQITPKNGPKGSTQHLGELSCSLLAEVLQVRDVIWYDQVNPRSVECSCLLLFAHVKLIHEKQILVFLTGHRHLFFLI